MRTSSRTRTDSRIPGKVAPKTCCGFRAVHLSSSENHSCMKFFTKDFNRSNVVACFKMVKYETAFENCVNARLLVQPTQYTVIVVRRNVDQYFYGARTSNPGDSVRVRLPADIVRPQATGGSMKEAERQKSHARMRGTTRILTLARMKVQRLLLCLVIILLPACTPVINDMSQDKENQVHAAIATSLSRFSHQKPVNCNSQDL